MSSFHISHVSHAVARARDISLAASNIFGQGHNLQFKVTWDSGRLASQDLNVYPWCKNPTEVVTKKGMSIRAKRQKYNWIWCMKNYLVASAHLKNMLVKSDHLPGYQGEKSKKNETTT